MIEVAAAGKQFIPPKAASSEPSPSAPDFGRGLAIALFACHTPENFWSKNGSSF
jgi:hypothetical protein